MSGTRRPTPGPEPGYSKVSATTPGKADEQGEEPQEFLRRVDLPGHDFLETVIRHAIELRADAGRALYHHSFDRPACC